MIFFGAFRNGWEMDRFHIFQIATVLALWGVVISTVYMLRAYRKTFMGSLSERWKDVVDLRHALRSAVALLVVGLLAMDFFRNHSSRSSHRPFATYLTIDRHLTDVEHGHGAVSPSSTEQHRPSASTQRGGSNIRRSPGRDHDHRARTRDRSAGAGDGDSVGRSVCHEN